MANVTLLRQQADDAHARATTLSMQLNALLLPTWGESGDHFRDMANEMQDCYMWACSDMAREIVKALNEMTVADNAIDAAQRKQA